MPHIHVEYSANVEQLDVKPLLLGLNQAMLDGGYIAAAHEVKSRAICQHDFVIGLNDPEQAYIHIKVSLLTGRSIELQTEISQKLLSVAKVLIPPQKVNLQLCVEILEMPKATYSKSILVG
jgi:5-carboxymethyl-2-hydroxymuconate isomerase